MSLIGFTPVDSSPTHAVVPPSHLLRRDFLPVGCAWRFVCPAAEFGIGPTYWCHVPTRSLWDEVSETWIGTDAEWEGWMWTKTQSTIDALRNKPAVEAPIEIQPAPAPTPSDEDQASAPACAACAVSSLVALACILL